MKGKKNRKSGMKQVDIEYLMDTQRKLLEMELKKSKPSKRFLSLLKNFSSVSKRVEGYTSFLKGFDVDTGAMGWIIELYSNTPPSTPEYDAMSEVIANYTKAQIWVGYFFSLVNTFNHALTLRQLSTAEKIVRKMQLEVERARRIFREYDMSLKKLKSTVLGMKEEEPELEYFE